MSEDSDQGNNKNNVNMLEQKALLLTALTTKSWGAASQFPASLSGGAHLAFVASHSFTLPGM